MNPEASPAAVPDNRHSAMMARVVRVRALETAAELVGYDRLAVFMSMAPRTLRAKLTGDRGLTDKSLLDAATALERRGSEFFAHARKIRDLTAGSNGG